jgi:hypothetical protein
MTCDENDQGLSHQFTFNKKCPFCKTYIDAGAQTLNGHIVSCIKTKLNLKKGMKKGLKKQF